MHNYVIPQCLNALGQVDNRTKKLNRDKSCDKKDGTGWTCDVEVQNLPD